MYIGVRDATDQGMCFIAIHAPLLGLGLNLDTCTTLELIKKKKPIVLKKTLHRQFL